VVDAESLQRSDENPESLDGYVGDPNVNHGIIGSPLGTNVFRIDGPDVGGPRINTISTNEFTVTGKLNQ
jgi:hypothetical protein